MDIVKGYSRTFLKIVAYISVAMIIIILFFSNTLYKSYEKAGLDFSYELNKKNVNQLSKTIDYMNNIAKNFCISEFSAAETEQLMYDKNIDEENYFIKLKNIAKLQKAVVSNPMINSVIVYNGFTEKFYSTKLWIDNEDKQIVDMINKKEDPVLYPIPRVLPKEIYTKDTKVFTYMMYDSIDDQGNINGALFVNVNIDWLVDNLNEIKADKGNLYIINKEGEIIADEKGDTELFKELNRTYVDTITQNTAPSNSFIDYNKGSKIVVTHFPIPNTEWILISEQSYNSVFQHIKQMKNITFFVTMLIIVLALLISILVSSKIYTPFNKLVYQVKSSLKGNYNDQVKDDAKYLSEAFSTSVAKLKELESYKESTRDILKENLIKTMLLEWNTSNNIPKEYFQEYEDLYVEQSRFTLILFKIDGYNDLIKFDAETRKLTRYIIVNALNLVMEDYCMNESFITGSDEIIIILDNINSDTKEYSSFIHEKIKEIQNRVCASTDFTVSAFISYREDRMSSLYESYVELQEICKYRVIYGHGCILDKKSIEKNLKEEKFNYPYQIEKKLIDELKLGNIDSVNDQLSHFIYLASTSNIDNFMLAVTRMALAINREVNQININKMNDISISFNNFYTDLIKLETVTQIKASFISLFERIIEQNTVDTQSRHHALIHSIKEYIMNEYMSKELSLKSIAAKFKMSTVYLGTIFRENCDISIQEYINSVRLEKAAERLKNSSNSIASIIESVGYENVSNFYKLFKKNYGVTPKQYRMKN